MNTRSEFPTAETSSNMNGFGTTQIASTLDALKASVAGETGASAKYAGYAKAADEAGVEFFVVEQDTNWMDGDPLKAVASSCDYIRKNLFNL